MLGSTRMTSQLEYIKNDRIKLMGEVGMAVHSWDNKVHVTLLASYPGLPMFFNVSRENREGLVDYVM